MNTNTINQQIISPRLLNLIIAFLAAVLFWQFMDYMAFWAKTSFEFAHPMFRVFGGDGVNGFIKVVGYTAFVYLMLELRGLGRYFKRENDAFYNDLLPQQEQLVLSPGEVADIKLRVLQLEQRNFFYIINSLIKKCATQYRNENSISDTMQILDSQIETGKNQEEGKLEEARYIIQTIPMLGFIGTILELTRSLALVSIPGNRSKLLDVMPGHMASAFDATVVALILTIILTFRYHKHLEVLDTFFARAKSHVMDNLISRIYKQ